MLSGVGGRERGRLRGGGEGVEDISTVADGRERGERLYGEKLSCPSVFVIRERPAGLEAEITSSDPKTNLPRQALIFSLEVQQQFGDRGCCPQ